MAILTFLSPLSVSFAYISTAQSDVFLAPRGILKPFLSNQYSGLMNYNRDRIQNSRLSNPRKERIMDDGELF